VDYISLTLKIHPREPFAEIATYQLSESGFEMFEETDLGIVAYCQNSNFDQHSIDEILLDLKASGASVEVEKQIIPWKNWNQEWESNYHPEVIDGKLLIRAEFHEPDPKYPMEIVVQPRMAFGTGHHPTTSQVMKMMLNMDFKDKSVLDMGSGTGILAILAKMLGANRTLAIDNDSNAVENSKENAIRNSYSDIEVELGEGNAIGEKKFDIILANINRNIILNDLKWYASYCKINGLLFLSGFYVNDLEAIKAEAEKFGFVIDKVSDKNEWCCVTFKKEN
jgi:ribosomal protein L11 methyltransferase